MEERLTLGNIRFKMTPFRAVMVAFATLFVVIGAYRFATGLGTTTNLSDRWPWGLWILIDVKLGVALAAGGFTTCGLYYVLGIKKFKPIVKPALLTAWIGYLLVAVGLLFDLGRWYNFWRPMLFWGHRSVMFELFWCVLLYTIVLTCEFTPTLSARLGLNRIKKLLVPLTLPLVILGIVLSTMHQSSLGSLYIIMLGKLHPLWWTMLLPICYFLTAVAVGPAVVTVESFLSARAYGREFELDIMQSLGKFTAWVMALYLVVKMADLGYRNQFAAMFEGSLASKMFLLEIVVGVILPVILYAAPGVRKTASGVVMAAALVIFGVVLNRFNVVFTGMVKAAGSSYFPSWMEIAISLGLVSIGILAYLFVVENFGVFAGEYEEDSEESVENAAVTRPSFPLGHQVINRVGRLER